MSELVESQQKQFEIPTENLPLLEERIAKLNKTAAKLDVEPITIEMQGEPKLVEHGHNGVRVFTEVVSVWIEGKAPQLEGWTFVATLEHSEGGTVLRRIPGNDADLSAYYEASADDCDQCGYRRRRNNTYVVQHEDGRLKQVGSNCLKDFLGHISPQQHAKYAEYLRDLMDELRGGGYRGIREPELFNAVEYLARVAKVTRERGWVSRKDAWDEHGDSSYSTASIAQAELFRRLQGADNREVAQPSVEDYTKATAAIEWARNLDDPDNDYLHNLHTVLEPGTIRVSQFGIAALAINAHGRALERQARENAPARSDEYVGAVGERITRNLTVIQVYENQSENWGLIYKHIMRDNEGHTFVWHATNGTKLEGTNRVYGTIKGHEETQYGKQTVINRCKVVD